ncbi:MAG: hypothetical protein E7288_09030 [Lachnospiraceae bacterium]|nr:hypothetical protein [Lachnospiraceae bacterium]
MEEVLLHMKEMGIFLVVGSLFQYLLPSQEYARYVRLLTITVLLVYFALPVLRLFAPDGVEQFQTNCETYYTRILGEMNRKRQADSFTSDLEGIVEQKWYEWVADYQEGEETEEWFYEMDR